MVSSSESSLVPSMRRSALKSGSNSSSRFGGFVTVGGTSVNPMHDYRFAPPCRAACSGGPPGGDSACSPAAAQPASIQRFACSSSFISTLSPCSYFFDASEISVRIVTRIGAPLCRQAEVLDGVRTGVKQIAVRAREGEEGDLMEVRIALVEAEERDPEDVANEVLLERPEEDGFRAGGNARRHIVVDIDGIAEEGRGGALRHAGLHRGLPD